MAADGWTMVEGVERAALTYYLRLTEKNGDTLPTALGQIPQHEAAVLASAQDDALIAALNAQAEGRWPL